MTVPRSRIMRYGVAALAVLVDFAIRLALEPLIKEGSSFLLFSLAVLVAAVFGGFGPGVFATFLAAVIGDYFFLSPVGTLLPPSFEHGLRTTLFAIQGLAISGIGAALMSARRRTGEALESSRRAEESYRDIFENAVDGIFRATGDGRILTANPALANMLGYESPKDLLHGASNYARFYAEPARGEEFVEMLREDGETRNFELRLRRKDGREIWASISSRVVREDEEGHMLFEGIIEDVTERKRAEDALRLRERAISESANGITITDAGEPENPIIYVNAAFEQITGYPAEEVLGHNCRFLQGMDRYQPALEELREAIGEERPYTVVLRNYKKDGTPFWNELSVSPVRDEAGDVTHFVGVQEDVTRRRRAEEDLWRSEERLRQATDAADLGTWDYNLLTGELAWDERCKEVFGLPPDAGVDYAVFLAAVHPEDRQRVEQEIQRALDPESGGGYRDEYRAVGFEDGVERWVGARGQAFFEESGRAARLTGTVLDVTERKREEERQHLLSEAGAELAASLDYEHSLSSVARLCVPDFADWCAVDVLSEDGEIQRLAVEHQDPEMVRWAHELQRRYPPDPEAPRGLARVLRSGEAEFYPEVTEEMLEAAIEDEEQRGMLRRVGFTSVVIVPMIVRGRILGAITLVTAESGRRYEQRDLEIAGELARRAAAAVDNAGLYGALKQSDDRYRTFIEQATEGIWRFELEETAPADLPEDEQIEHVYRHAYLAECNDAMARMYGYSRAEEIEGARLGDMLPREIPENVEYLEAFIRSGYSLSGVESREFDREGNPRFFLNNLTGIAEDGLLVRAWGTQRDITERKQVEQALEESEEQYRVVAETASDGIVMIDEESRILFANSSLARIFGYASEELLGQQLTTLMPEYLRHVHEASLRRYLDTGERHLNWDSMELPGLHGSGREIPLEVSFGEFVKEGRRFFTGFIRDITERKQAERELRESEQRFRATFEQAAVGVAHVGLDGSWLRVNERLCDIVGYSREELLEITFQDITHPEDLETDLGHLHQLLAGEISRYSMEKRYFRKGGSVVWINLTVSLVRDAEGQPDYFVSVIEDITERKEVEVRYRTLVEQIPAVTYILDVESNTITYLSPQFEEVMGYSPREYLSIPELRKDSTHPEDREWVVAEDRRTIETGEPLAVEYRKIRRDGRVIWVREEAILVGDSEGRPMYWQGLFADITERRETEERLREAREAEQVRIAQDLHDTVLQDMAFAVQEINVRHILAEGRGEEDPELEGIAETLRRGIESLRAAVFELRLQGEAERPFAEAVESLVDLNRRMARHRFTIEMNVGESVPEHLLGPARVEITRIIQEALSNVRKYSGARHVNVRLESEGGEVWAEVSDDGRGFEVGEHSVGLGTSSMHNRARRLGGKLEITSRRGEGTSVIFRAPRENLLGGEQGV